MAQIDYTVRRSERARRVRVTVDAAPPADLDVPGGTAKDENDRRRRDAVLNDRQVGQRDARSITVPGGNSTWSMTTPGSIAEI